MRDALELVERADSAARCRLLDEARARVGRPATAKVDAAEAVAAASRAAMARASSDNRPMRIGLCPAGVPIDLNEVDDERARARVDERSRRQLRQAREAERRVEATERGRMRHPRVAG